MNLKNNLNGLKPIYKTTFQMKIVKDKLVANFISEHCSLNSYSNKYNDDIWHGDVVEIFIDVGKYNHYYELEVAPNNTCFLANITNDGKSFKGEKIQNNFFKSTTKIIGETVYTTIEIKLKDIDYNKKYGIKYNAFRIETDNEKEEKYLFALSPTKCNTFHKKEFFIKL